ncbi:MAG TPA: RagB/SusD family nutrient uptake outer membrane protein [Puia sp.]|nr:RagB/SusD family nutrient uptake outer membrane protein [Puia sp.]
MNKFKLRTSPIFGYLFLIALAWLPACKKQDDWLNAKRRNGDVTPSTLQDFQAVLDGTNVVNFGHADLALLGTDNVYLTSTTLSGANPYERNSYLWASDIYEGSFDADWSQQYETIEYSNIVLDGLAKIQANVGNQAIFDNVKGSALFYRAMAFYLLADVYSKPYDSSTAASDPGIVLRLTSDINVPSTRSTVQKTYQQIITDLQTAATLLPVTPQFTTRPSQVSAFALLAKVYLVIGDYTNAGAYANKALSLNNTLLDYNSSLVNPGSAYRFPSFSAGNPEIIFYATSLGYRTLSPASSGTGNIDSVLYGSYDNNDLRKTLFFIVQPSGLIKAKGTYSGQGYNFGGIANDEIYLIRSECYARSGNAAAAMTDLNALLAKRFKTGTFVPYTATTSDDALTQILRERRKELPLSGLARWEDLRRLGRDSQFAVTVTHVYNGTTYTLSPNDKRYVYPIPDQEIQLYGLKQNPR